MKLNRSKLRKMILAEMKELVQINPAGAPGMGASQKGPRGYGDGRDYSDGNYVTNGVFDNGEFSTYLHYAWVKYNRALQNGEFRQGGGGISIPEGIYWIMANIIKDPVAIEKGFAASRAYHPARDLQHAIVDYNNYIAADGITTVNKLTKEMNVA